MSATYKSAIAFGEVGEREVRQGQYTVRMLQSVSVDKIVARTQFSISEPSHISMSKRSRLDMGEWLVPSNQLLCKGSPKFIGVLDGFLVLLLIFF